MIWLVIDCSFTNNLVYILYYKKVKGKGFPYSLLSTGPGDNHGVQAVSPQAVGCHYFLPDLPSRTASPPLGQYQVILLGDRGT